MAPFSSSGCRGGASRRPAGGWWARGAYLIASACLLTLTHAGSAADLGRGPDAGRDPYSPTAPIGFASEFPRSPLEDVFVNGFQRFVTPAAAQAHCPRDVVVAVPFFAARYERPGQNGGSLYMCRTDAVAEGDRPASGR